MTICVSSPATGRTLLPDVTHAWWGRPAYETKSHAPTGDDAARLYPSLAPCAVSHGARRYATRCALLQRVCGFAGEGPAAWPGLTQYWRPTAVYPDGHAASSYVL